MAALTRPRLSKHYEGDHDQKDHGNWAGLGRDELAAMLAGYPSIDLSRIDEYDEYESMSVRDYINDYMDSALDEQVEYYLNEWRDENPDAVIEPDEEHFREMAYESLEDIAEERLSEAKEEIYALLLEEASDVYGVSGTGPNGEEWESSVESVYVTMDGVSVEGRFYVDGAYAGNFERQISPDNAYRALLVIEDKYSGLGIASAFNHQEEMAYLKSGIKNVTISAMDLSNGDFNKPPGTYVWASQGYDWQGGYVPGNVLRAMERFASGPEFQAMPDALQRTVTDAITRAGLRTGDVPTPREISQLGRLPGSDWWAGKSIMAHSGATIDEARTGYEEGPGWSAVKNLADRSGLRVSLGEIRSQQARRDTFRAIDQHVAAWRQSNPQLDLGVEFIMVNGQPVPIEPSDGQVLRLMGK
jgi:hypothetical protein